MDTNNQEFYEDEEVQEIPVRKKKKKKQRNNSLFYTPKSQICDTYRAGHDEIATGSHF